MQQQHTFSHVRCAEASNDSTKGYLTWLKSNESTRNLVGSKNVCDRRVQNYRLKMDSKEADSDRGT